MWSAERTDLRPKRRCKISNTLRSSLSASVAPQSTGCTHSRTHPRPSDASNEWLAANWAFKTGGQELARAFSKAHVEASRDGAFFVFELEVGLPDTVLYSLVKYDYRSAIEFTAKEGRQSLRAIVQAFVTERRAIQKSCFVRVVAGQAETLVSAFDRMGRAPDLTDYFATFSTSNALAAIMNSA